MVVVKRLWAAAASVALLAALAAIALQAWSDPAGLSATGESLGGPSRTITTVDPEPTANRVLAAWGGAPPDAFRMTWRGVIYVPYDGAYTFATRADGETSIYLDGRKILENGWNQPELTVRQSVRPDSGLHNLTITYIHNVGPIHLEVLWARGDEPLAAVPASALLTRRVPWWRVLAARAIAAAAPPLDWIAVALVLAAIGFSLARRAGASNASGPSGAPPALLWIVGGSLLLNAVGIGWGLDGAWGVLEVTPAYVLGAISAHFANGWYHAYPPLHFLVLAIVTSPVVLLDALGRISVQNLFWIETMLLMSRLVTLAMAAGTLIAIYFCGARASSRRSCLFAAAIFALAAPFVYFAKMANVDVPYLFWFALSLVFYAGLMQGDHTRDYIGLAVAAALAVCTKDQAYGLFLGMPIVLLAWKGFDRRMIVAAAVSACVFALADNVIFNFAGFVDHVRFIVGPGNTVYRVYDATIVGRLHLLAMTLRLLEWTWGWPLFAAGVAGIAVAAMGTPATRRAAVWLLVPVAGYYLSFINVILYVYDRFTLPMALVLALFGGVAFDRLWSSARLPRQARVAVMAAAFTYTFFYSSTVDVLMLRDSRYAVERWLAAQTFAPPDDLIVSNVISPYLPRLYGYRVGDVQTIEELQIAQPKFFILNADYMRGQAADSPVGRMIDALEQHKIGYSLVYRARRATPWPWSWVPGAHPDLVGDRLEPVFVSNLRNINPTIEVFQHDTTIGR